MLSQRRFGVEIECGFPEGCEAAHALLKREKIKPLSVGRDGSGVEVRSPILKGTSGLAWLKECMECLRENGGYVTNSDGMHVHHEGTPGYKSIKFGTLQQTNLIACIRFIKSWRNNDEWIDKFVQPRRRDLPWACAKVYKDAERIKAVEKGEPFPGKYSDINLSPLNSSKGTIEIRLHEGTLDFEEAEAWIRLCQSLLDTAAKGTKPVPKQRSLNALLDLLIDSDEIKGRLVAKAERDAAPSANSAWRDRHPDDD